jgi:hypothetical protein
VILKAREHRAAERPTDERRTTGWILFLTLAVVVTGMAYSLWWPAVVRHQTGYWALPGDLWGTVRAAHWIGWGGFSFVYSSQTGLVTLPGFDLLLTPVVMLSSALHLSESAPGFLPVPKPTAWLLVGPVTMACSAIALFAFDSLARHLAIGIGRRRMLALAEAAALWGAVAMWGHPEDVVALGLAVFAMVQLLKGHWAAAGWLLGAAIGAQLYIIVLVPLFLGVVGLRRASLLLARTAVIPGFLFFAVAIPNPRATFHALFDQPNFPTVDHATPWVYLAPKLGHGAVAAGPGRIIGLVVACGVGVLAARVRKDERWIIWLAATALAARCVFESVIDPYYVLPVVAVGLVAAASLDWRRLLLVCIPAAAVTDITYLRTGAWIYWLEMTGPILAILAMGLPLRRHEKAPASLVETSLHSPCRVEPSGEPDIRKAPVPVPASLPTS